MIDPRFDRIDKMTYKDYVLGACLVISALILTAFVFALGVGVANWLSQ